MLSARERQDLITEIMKDIKIQNDRKRQQITRSSLTINPQQLNISNPTTYGPYYFNVNFSTNPYMTFGQVRVDQSRVPLIVQPYIDRWISSSGGITGFYLGVYALTRVPAGLTQHIINAEAVATGSLYKNNPTNDKWNASYDNNAASHLEIPDGQLEKPY